MSINFKARKPIRLSKELLKDKRVLFSVAGSIMVVVFLIWSIAPMFTIDKVPANIFEAQEIRGYDLSQMPFSTDLVEGELLGQEAYKDIAEKGTTGVIYSKKDKKQRIINDKFGITDSRTKKKIATTKTTPTRRYSSGGSGVKQTTQVQQMASSGGFRIGGGGGGSSTSSKVWTGKDSKKSYGYGSRTGGVGASGIGLSNEDKKALARQIALQRAGKLSEQAAGSEDAAAADAAAEAFGGGEAAADLDTELEAMANELDLAGDISGLGEGNIADAISDAVDKAESNYERILPEMQIDPWEQFWMDVAMKFIDLGGNVATSFITNKYGDSEYEKWKKDRDNNNNKSGSTSGGFYERLCERNPGSPGCP